jgi:L-alanine-DL-glutamate epimerase-like enolase superfamily enzyme
MKVLAKHNIYWIEEPTAPDDAYGHSIISKEMKKLGIRVATGEHCSNRILHKQFMAMNGY